eukprot:TRINITY_DN11826_c0_g1_i1.p1 TRINITY_DN11826_c0_g1~~TRINITY_DN11826_c0_g1_i1.p1  ORF type:complete len:640 (+),score=62.94 TRINITY_DN11826_c0_g1_i1:285-1922(+)
MTDFHPESWNPAWSIESMLVGVISFMIDESEPTSVGALHESAEKRLSLASQSRAFNLENPEFCELFPEWAEALRSSPTAIPSSALTSRSQSDVDAASTSPAIIEKPTELEVQPCNPIDITVAMPTSSQPPPSKVGASTGDTTADFTDSSKVEDVEDPSSECWICRDDTNEPLIYPCACRGSMSGVHTSCVESWLAHHRTNSNDEVAQCSVCNQPYCGTETQPGLFGYLKHVCQKTGGVCLRSLFRVGIVLVYWTAAQPDILPLPLRIALLVPCCGMFLYDTFVLAVSLPRGTPCPNNRLRAFHTSDFRKLAMHTADTITRVVLSCFWYATGMLQLPFFLLVCAVMMLPLCSVLARCGTTQTTLRGMVYRIATELACPIFLLIGLARMVWLQPHRLVDPFDAQLHILVTFAIHPLCWFCTTNVPLFAVLAVHSVGSIVAIFEVGLLRGMPWKDGRSWWIFAQLACLSAYTANFLNNFKRGLFWKDSPWLIGVVSIVWLSLCSTLAICVNWHLCVRQYRHWQHRNGSFALHSTTGPPPQQSSTTLDP